jgi:hypothetical protein
MLALSLISVEQTILNPPSTVSAVKGPWGTWAIGLSQGVCLAHSSLRWLCRTLCPAYVLTKSRLKEVSMFLSGSVSKKGSWS